MRWSMVETEQHLPQDLTWMDFQLDISSSANEPRNRARYISPSQSQMAWW